MYAKVMKVLKGEWTLNDARRFYGNVKYNSVFLPMYTAIKAQADEFKRSLIRANAGTISGAAAAIKKVVTDTINRMTDYIYNGAYRSEVFWRSQFDPKYGYRIQSELQEKDATFLGYDDDGEAHYDFIYEMMFRLSVVYNQKGLNLYGENAKLLRQTKFLETEEAKELFSSAIYQFEKYLAGAKLDREMVPAIVLSDLMLL